MFMRTILKVGLMKAGWDEESFREDVCNLVFRLDRHESDDSFANSFSDKIMTVNVNVFDSFMESWIRYVTRPGSHIRA